MANRQGKAKPVINPGPGKDVWDEALERSGIDPAEIVEYNTPDDDAAPAQQPVPLSN